jgi:PKD repeat protein
MRRPGFLLVLVCALAFVAIALPTAGYSAPPANDDFVNATGIAGLPASTSGSISEATIEPGEPTYYGQTKTAWYAFTPATDVTVRVDPAGSDYYTILYVWRATGPGLADLSYVTNDYFAAPLVFDAQGGVTYYVQAGDMFGGGGAVNLQLTAVPPPTNDDFSDATNVTSLPFADNQDFTGATLEPGEPNSICAGDYVKTVWYRFTPTADGLYSVSAFGDIGYAAAINVYTGASLENLTRLTCGGSGGLGTFHGAAGTTYYVQSGTYLTSGSFETRIQLAPPPAVGFIWGPSYPSSFDTLTFNPSESYDPAGIGIQTWSWALGDGTTSTEAYPQHKYAKDGDYSVTLTGTTSDGRTSSDTQVVQVQTHDVSIQSMTTPSKGRVGRTAQVEVGIGNRRYPESVRVDFFKSTPGGFEQIGSVTEDVQVMKHNKKTVAFSVDYTFTSDDLAVGKVSFQAVATILGDRPAIDAFPSDNTQTSTPTIVKK